jgi:CO/xanthine dehydrogenase Mo-binding subunit
VSKYDLQQKSFVVTTGQRVEVQKGHRRFQFIADIFCPAYRRQKFSAAFPHAHPPHRHQQSRASRRAPVVTAEGAISAPEGFADQYILSVGKRATSAKRSPPSAIDPDIAEEAVDLIEVDWEPLPGVFDAEEAMQDGAPLVHDDKPNNIAMTMDIERGNIAQAFAESDVIVEDTFQSMPQWHCSIETIGSVAEYAPGGKYTIYMNTQTLFNARYRIAAALGVPETDVRIIQSAVGGGWRQILRRQQRSGRRGAARKARKPVKLINTREENFSPVAGEVFMKINVSSASKRRSHPRQAYQSDRRQRRLLRQGAGNHRSRRHAPRYLLQVYGR